MSITIGIPQAPTRTQPCDTCRMAGDRCWEHCDGTEEVSIAPEVNWANANARQVLDLLGLGREDYGQIPASEVSGILQRANICIARRQERSLAREPTKGGGQRRIITREDGLTEITTTCQWQDCGSPAAHWTYRMESLREVLSWAARHNLGVSWG